MLTYTQGWSTRGVSFQALQDLITKNKSQSWSISLELYEGKPTTLKGQIYRKIRWFYRLILIIWILFALIIPTRLFGEEADKKSKEESKNKTDFVLTIKDNLISLNAKDASLVEIVEEIGNRMKIDIVTKIPKEKKITTKFDKLPLKAAIERLREFADIAYIVVPQNPPSKITTSDPKDSEKKEAKITKILVFPKGKGVEVSKPEVSAEEEGVEEEAPTKIEGEEAVEKESSRPEPFKFEFDPSEFEEE